MSRLVVIFLAALIPAPVALGSMAVTQPLLLVNTSPSEPLGLYRAVAKAPAPGSLVAFRPPPVAHAYLATAAPGRARSSFLKTVVAGEGSLACGDGRTLRVDGRRLGRLQDHDRAGRALPRWRGCARLGPGQLLVFSGRVPNSFDSRYYGPIDPGAVFGVYAPLWVAQGAKSHRRGW